MGQAEQRGMNADITDYDPATNTLELVVSADKIPDFAKELQAQGYTVAVDGVIQ